jgi:hypothetical protein
MSNKTVQRFEWALRRIGGHAAVVGSSLADLEDYQRERELVLPADYIRFLSIAGEDAGDFLKGSDFLFVELDNVRSEADALLEDDSGPQLPDGAFVFCCHHGYQFLFFCLGTNPDPPIYYYLEGDGDFKVVAAGFSEWLVDTVLDELPDEVPPTLSPS